MSDEVHELRRRLQQAEAALEALQGSEVDAVVRKDGVALLREVEERLHTSEEKYRRLVESAAEYAIFLLDPNGHITSWNIGAQRIYQYRAEEILGQDFSLLYPAEAIQEGQPQKELELASSEGRCEEDGWRRRRDGTLFWASASLTRITNDAGRLKGYSKIVRDLSKKRQSEEALRRSNQLSDALNRINEAVHSSLDLEEVLQRLVQTAAEALGSDSAAVTLRHPRGWQVRSLHGMPSELVGTILSNDQERHAVLACEQRRPIAISHAFEDPRVDQAHLRRHGIRSVLVAPLIVQSEALGNLYFNFHRQRHVFSAEEMNFARQVAATAATALENARLFRVVEETKEQLRRALAAGRTYSFERNVRNAAVWRSDNAPEILGLDPPEANQSDWRTHLECVHPADRDPLRQVLKELAPEAADYETEYRYLRPNGSTIWLQETGTGEFDEYGELVRIRGLVADVTDRVTVQKQATRHAAAAAAAQSAVDIVNAMGEGVALLAMDGRLRTVNPAFTRLTEYATSELEGRFIQDILPDLFDEQEEQIQETLIRVRLKQSRIESIDALSATNRSGVQIWVVPTLSSVYGQDNEPVAMVLTLRNITPLMRAQRELEASERKYRELVEDANAIMVRANAEQRITFVNDYAEAFFGYAPGELLGRPLVGTILPETDSAGTDLRKLAEGIVAHPELHGSVDSENRRKDGSRVWVHWSNRAIRDDRGGVREVLGVGADITRRVRLEQESERYRQRLKNLANRLVSTEEQERRRVAAHLHDTVIQTLSLSNIRLGGLRAGVSKAGLDEVCQRIDSVRTLLDQGIRECRDLMGELVPPLLYEVGVAAALEGFAERQSRTSDSSIEVVAGPGLELLDHDLRNMLFQSARELTMNALKHAGPCSIRICLSCSNDEIRLQVKDTGQGFDPDLLRRSSEYDHQGGFGFFNLRERLESLGGALVINSAPGHGTTITLRVPVGEGGGRRDQ